MIAPGPWLVAYQILSLVGMVLFLYCLWIVCEALKGFLDAKAEWIRTSLSRSDPEVRALIERVSPKATTPDSQRYGPK